MARFQPIFPQREFEREIEEEIAYHIEARTNDLIARGMRPDEARAEALRRFGDPRSARDACRRVATERFRAERRVEIMQQAKRDAAYSLRGLTRRPGFAALIILILSLGIGGTTAMFSIVDRVVLRPLPFQEPDRIVVHWGTESGLKTGSSWNSYPDVVDIEAASDVFESLGFWSRASLALTGGGSEPIQVPVGRISHDLFSVLGVGPLMGRAFQPEDDRPGAESVALISNGLWESRFASDPEVLGATLSLDGVAHTIVGVMPPGFDFPDERLLWVPAGPIHFDDSRGQHRLMVAARLKNGVTLSKAEVAVRAIAERLAEEYPETNTGRSARLEPLHDAMVGNARPGLLLLLGAVGIVLLIVCANVANLLLARATSRRKEVAIRSALGAGRGRIVSQLLTESLVLAIIGGALGTLLSFGGVELLRTLIPGEIPRLDDAGSSGRVLIFACLITCLTGSLFGLLPALQSSKPNLQSFLKQGARSALGGRTPRVRQTLVVIEMALAVVLLVGAGLFLNSLLRLQRVDPGFTARGVLVVPLALPPSRFPLENEEKITGFFQSLIERIEALPGVEKVAAGYEHPLSGGWETAFEIKGVLEAPRGERPEARIRPVTPDYFETAGIPLREGRFFTERDVRDSPGVVIINRSLARTFFNEESPIGHRLVKSPWWPFQTSEWEIVGVVGDVKMDGLTSSTPWAMYFPHSQMPFSEMQLLVATTVDPHSVVGPVRAAVWAADPQLPVENVRTLDEIRRGSIAPQRFQAQLLGGFAMLALVLSAVGIYGVLSYSVVLRTGEIGLRMSLGASSGAVLRLVLRQALRLVLIGTALGLVGAFATTRLVSRLLFQVSPTDPATLIAVTAGLVLVALAASAIPALRAARVDPMTSLRAE